MRRALQLCKLVHTTEPSVCRRPSAAEKDLMERTVCRVRARAPRGRTRAFYTSGAREKAGIEVEH
eukprot:351973-Chlamydomonas_euryale.AAC.1